MLALLAMAAESRAQDADAGRAASDRARIAAWITATQAREREVSARFVAPPGGTSYRARVPDTLDLADRARRALNCLTGALDPQRGGEIYFTAWFEANPPYMCHEGTGLPTNNPKFAESMPMMRVMSGSTQGLDIERAMLARTLALVADDGLYYAPALDRPWHGSWHAADDDFANVYGNGRLLLALLAWYQYDGNPLWQDYAARIVAGLRRIARFENDMAWFPDPGFGEPFSYRRSGYPAGLWAPTDRNFGVHMYFSGVIRGLAQYAALTGDRDALEFACKLATFVRQPGMWGTDGATSVRDGERARFSGHFHAHVASLRALLEYAIVADDAQLKAFAHGGYEHARQLGLRQIGWFPEDTAPGHHCEACCTADMVALAIKLSDAGLGDYWEDVDRYVRNQLVEHQLLDRDCLEQLAKNSPRHAASSPRETDERVIERTLGGFAGHSGVGVLPHTFIMQCCTANASQALYYAWEACVREHEGTVAVNLLLNRSSPWLDVDSYLPYAGRVVIHNKTARQVTLRLPAWVTRDDVRCTIDDRLVDCAWQGGRLCFPGTEPGQAITVEFGVVDSTAQAVLDGTEYTLRFRGNTLVGWCTPAADRAAEVSDGEFLLSRPSVAIANGVRVADVRVRTQARSAAEAGIVLRYRDPQNFLLAIFANQEIYFHEVVGGSYGDCLDRVPATGFADSVRLVAEVSGAKATLVVSDASKSVSTSHAIRCDLDAGGVGLFHNRTPTQSFADFAVSGMDGETLFHDEFAGQDSMSRWRVFDLGTPGYPIYRREHMLAPEAPMVETTRYVSDAHIRG